MTTQSISKKLNDLPPADRRFLKMFAGVALASLLIGLFFGLATALIRTGYAEAEPDTGYRMMTEHGVTVFFYWLYFAQMAFLLALAASQFEGSPRIAWAPAAWTGLLAMMLGFFASQVGTFLPENPIIGTRRQDSGDQQFFGFAVCRGDDVGEA